MSHSATDSCLISPSALQSLLTDASQDVLVVDCRFNLADTEVGAQAWSQAHVPGAVYAHLDRDLSGNKTGANGRHPLPTWQDWQATLQRWGLTPATQVVAYDDAGGMFAARLWWMLRHWSGHARVAVLDGGWQGWLQAGGIVSTQSVHRAPSAWQGSADESAMVDVNTVLAHVAHPHDLQLLDARAPDRFAGQNETLDPVGGHIPGAINRFFKFNLQDSGSFKPASLLREEFTAQLQGVTASQVIHQCGSGVTACHNLLAMELAGLTGSRLYPGSWSEWCADASRPVITAE